VLEIQCSKGINIFLILSSESVPVTLVKLGDVCYVDKFIDIDATKSLSKWRMYLDFIKKFCFNPQEFLFNVKRRDKFKIPKEYWQIVKIFVARGWEVDYIGKQPVLTTSPEAFCAKERVLLFHAP